MSETPPPGTIYIIRHGEKPSGTPPGKTPAGVDFAGNVDKHSLVPRGWQRSGALATLFHPAVGPPRAGLRTPAALLAPSCGSPHKAAGHRSYQTIQGLSDRLGVKIDSSYDEGEERKLASYVLSSCSGAVLICWEHDHIPPLAASIPAVQGTVIPQTWPGDRFDVIWAFTLVPGTDSPQYAFSQIPQLLLSGDADTVISP